MHAKFFNLKHLGLILLMLKVNMMFCQPINIVYPNTQQSKKTLLINDSSPKSSKLSIHEIQKTNIEKIDAPQNNSRENNDKENGFWNKIKGFYGENKSAIKAISLILLLIISFFNTDEN